MKKAFDQTVRDLKREVNKKVLKVPGIEQKVLDATSNEPWGPHGSNLADIAQATRNYQEFQMIMTVIWKRINDTGKNWRHVYKALTVLEYLVAHGSERVIDEIKEHAYQLSTLSDFQYIDSSGRDQGSNVRRKSQSLVALVNDKERVHEVRQKALANKDKYRSTFSTGGTHRHGSHSSGGGYGDQYDDDRYEGRYGSRDDERNGYGRERDWANRDDERYGRTGDTYNRDGDRYGRDTDERFGKENYRDGDYRGRGNDDDQYGAKNRSIDRDMGKSYEEDDHYSSRSSGGKADGFSQNERHLEHKLSDTTSTPPSYEEAIKDTQNHINDERDGRSAPAPVQKASSPLAPKAASPAGSTTQDPDHIKFVATPKNDTDGFDEFDPRGSASAVQPAASTPSLDFFGSFSASDPANSSALVPVASATATSGPDVASNSGMGMNFVASTTACAGSGQPVEDPFGDSPFKATPHENLPAQPQSSIASGSYNPGSIGCTQPTAAFASADTKSETAPSFNFEDTLGGITYTSSIPNSQHSFGNPATQSLELPGSQATNDILDAFLSPAGSANLSPLPVHPVGLTHVQTTQVNLPQAVVSVSLAPPAFPVPSQMAQPATPVPTNVQTFPSLIPQSSAMVAGYASQAAPISAGPTIKTHPSKDKLELKSTVWADTLSRGLVDLNISGPKTNPLADIGIDFDSINRMEKRKEAKSSAAPVTSTITMGKPMGTGTSSGRAGASGLAPPPNPMMGSSMGMGGYGGNMNQPMGMGMGMNMGMVGRPPMGMPPPGPGMAGGGYNPMMGMGNYGPQQPYGGGYR